VFVEKKETSFRGHHNGFPRSFAVVCIEDRLASFAAVGAGGQIEK
jgi:hypothetical protein